MRVRLALLLALTTVSCASARMAGRDVVAVAKAPVHEWKTVAAGAAAIGAALLVDDELARIARNNDSTAMDRITDAVEPLGGGASDKVMAGFLLYGLAAENDRARAVAFDSIVSSVIASKAITPALKELTGRERPNGGDADAFPSNHATQAFAVASVIAAHYDDRRWVKWAAYSLATGVGIARVYHDAHWTSDVLAGAAIGSFVGNTVVKTNRAGRAKWRVAPCMTPSVPLCVSVSLWRIRHRLHRRPLTKEGDHVARERRAVVAREGAPSQLWPRAVRGVVGCARQRGRGGGRSNGTHVGAAAFTAATP